MHDQVCLFAIKNKLTVDVETAIQMLDYLNMASPQMKLQYFLSNAEEFKVILGGIEAVLWLKEGRSIFKQALLRRYNPNSPSNADECVEGKVEQPQQEELYHNVDLKEQQHLTQSKLTSLRRFFADIVSAIASCRYLSHYTVVKDVTSAFTLIEDWLIKTGFCSHNIEMLKQWKYLLNFIRDCHGHPDGLFKALVTKFSAVKTENIFLVVTVRELTDFVVSECSFDGVDRTTRQRRVAKFKTEIYRISSIDGSS